MRSLLAMTSVLSVSAIIWGCGSEPTTYAPNNTDSFTAYSGDTYRQANQVVAADYLFSLDTSRSMRPYQETLVETIRNSFIPELERSDSSRNSIDYRIGFVEGNYQNPTKLSSFGKSLMGGGYITSSSSTVVDNILAYLGQDLNPNVPNLIEASKVYMQNNSSFKRSGAQQVYIYITDCTRSSGDDESSGSASSYASSLKSAKGNGLYVSSRSIIATGSCPKIKETVRLLNSDSDPSGTGASGSVSGNYDIGSMTASSIASSLVSVARDITKKTGRFQLRGRPADNSLQVFTRLFNQANESKQTSGWRYESTTNEVVFNTAPAASTSIRFVYDIEYLLSSPPVIDSIRVLVNGQELTSGWRYDGERNRVLINNDSKPADGAKVEVVYEIS